MKAIATVILSALFLSLTGCSDSRQEMPEPMDDKPLSISFSASGFGDGISSRAGTHTCDADLNEGKVEKLDLLLVDAAGKIIGHYTTTDDATANRCDGIAHLLLKVDEKYPEFSRQNLRKEGNRLVLIANLDADLSATADIAGIADLSGLVHNQQQDKFVMAGEVAASAIGETGNVEITLERVAAKIKISLYNPARTIVNNVEVTTIGTQIETFESTLCHYVTDSPVMKEVKELTKAGKTSTVACHGQDWPDFFGETPPELTLENGIIKEYAHIFYTYPTDWYNYTDNTFSTCTRTHNNKHEAGIDYYTIRNYDDVEPIVAGRQVFVIVYAVYSGDGKQYYYKVPVNYRLSSLNDRQCFSATELDKVLSLYRADRNHFYDVRAIIDRAGAHTPEEAATNPYFTATIAPLIDGGTFDYIYD